jgi:hypothetical protein
MTSSQECHEEGKSKAADPLADLRMAAKKLTQSIASALDLIH